MTSYKSKSIEISTNIEQLFDKLSNLEALGAQLDSLPADQLAKIGSVRFENNQFIIATPQMGEIAFAIIDKHHPDKIVFGTPAAPLPLELVVNLEKVDENSTKVSTAFSVEIPAILRPMLGPKLQEAADKFGEMIGNMAR